MTVERRQRRFAVAAAANVLVHCGCLLPSCSAQSTGTNSHTGGGDSTFFGMSTNVAILVMVLISVVMIGIMLFVLQRQCKARKRSRLVSQVVQSRRDSTNANDYVTPMVTLLSERDESGSDTHTQELVSATSAAVVGCKSTVTEAAGCGGGTSDAALLQRNPLEASTGSASFGTLADLDTPDAGAVRSSSARVAHWLCHSVVPPPPPESPQFVTLRASSFLGARRSDGAAQNERPPADVYVRSTRAASCLVVNRDNGALQLTYNLPPVSATDDRIETRSPQSAASDPFR